MSQDPPVSSTIERTAAQQTEMTEVQRLPIVPEQPFGYQGPRLPLPTLLPPLGNPYGQQWHRSSPRLSALQPTPSTAFLPHANSITVADPSHSPFYTNRSPPAPQWNDRSSFRRPEARPKSYAPSPRLAMRQSLEHLNAHSIRSESEPSRSTGHHLTAPNLVGTPGFHSPWATPPSNHEPQTSHPGYYSPGPGLLPVLRPGPSPNGPGMQHSIGSGPSPSSLALPSEVSSRERPLNVRLRIRQQPEAARACGFGERDRRVIDPPPILQLEMITPESGQSLSHHQAVTVDVVHASLWNARGTSNVTNLSHPNHRSSRRLMGTLVASSATVLDEHNEEGSFFAFPDLSCRSQGRYRLRFSFMRIDPISSPSGTVSQIVAHVVSDVFTVYSAKDFPGMKPSTLLTLTLKQQGVAIQAKQGRYGASSKRNRDEEDEEDDINEEDAGSAPAARKREK